MTSISQTQKKKKENEMNKQKENCEQMTTVRTNRKSFASLMKNLKALKNGVIKRETNIFGCDLKDLEGGELLYKTRHKIEDLFEKGLGKTYEFRWGEYGGYVNGVTADIGFRYKSRNFVLQLKIKPKKFIEKIEIEKTKERIKLEFIAIIERGWLDKELTREQKRKILSLLKYTF